MLKQITVRIKQFHILQKRKSESKLYVKCFIYYIDTRDGLKSTNSVYGCYKITVNVNLLFAFQFLQDECETWFCCVVF